jgi:hypothetical protein
MKTIKPYSVEIQADSLEKARELINSKLPEGFSVISEHIVDYGKPKSTKCYADTLDEAYNKALKKVKDLVITKRKDVTKPELKTLTIEAFDEDNAKEKALKLNGKSAVIKNIQLISQGKKGFLGFNKIPNIYEVDVFIQASVELIYTPKMKVSFMLGKPRAKSDEHYILKCKDCGFVHHIPGYYKENLIEFIVNPDDVRIICIYGNGQFTVTLEVKEFFDIDILPATNMLLKASIGDNIKELHKHMKSHNDSLFLNIDQNARHTWHIYSKQANGKSFMKFAKNRGVDIIGEINLSKVEMPE